MRTRHWEYRWKRAPLKEKGGLRWDKGRRTRQLEELLAVSAPQAFDLTPQYQAFQRASIAFLCPPALLTLDVLHRSVISPRSCIVQRAEISISSFLPIVEITRWKVLLYLENGASSLYRPFRPVFSSFGFRTAGISHLFIWITGTKTDKLNLF